MDNNNIDDWQDVPVDNQQDDWQDVEPQSPSLLSTIANKVKSSGSGLADIAAPVADYANETVQGLGVGAAEGMTLGTMDELGGAISAGLETAASYVPGTDAYQSRQVDEQLKAQGFQVPEESFGEKYRGYQQTAAQAAKDIREQAPIAGFVGEIGGGMASGAALSSALGIGQGAQKLKSITDIAKDSGKAQAALELLKRGGKTYAQSLPLLIPEMAAQSEHALIGPGAEPEKVAADVAGGMAFGLPAILGMSAVADVAAPKAGQFIDESSQRIAAAFDDEAHPRLRQLKKAYQEYGQKIGIHPRSHGADIAEGGQAFAQRDQKAIGSVLTSLQEADSKLGQEVGESLRTATSRGAVLDISPEIEQAATKLTQLAGELPDLVQSRKATQAYEKVLTTKQQLTPLELKHLIDDLDYSYNAFKSATQLRPGETNTATEILRIRQQLSELLKKNVPEYRLKAERFENFRNVLEQLVSKDKPSDVTNKFLGSLNDVDNKLYSSLDDMIKNVQRDDAASQPSRTAFTNFMDALSKFQERDASRMQVDPSIKQVLPNVDSLRKFILNASDDSVLRGSVKATTQGRALVPDLKEAIIGKAPTSAAFWMGKMSKAPKVQKAADISRAVFKAPDTYLNDLASKLEATPGLGPLGKALTESIKNGNQAKKNAALFTIMQNPNAKLLISAEDLESEQDK